MSIKETIRQEIERRIKANQTKNGFPGGVHCAMRIEAYEGLLDFIDSLPEEKPSEDLEEAAENYIAPIENDEGLDYINFNGRDIKDAFITGAEWQKQQMMKGAVEGVVYRYESYQKIATAIIVDIPREILGNKVKLIIVKEDDPNERP